MAAPKPTFVARNPLADLALTRSEAGVAAGGRSRPNGNGELALVNLRGVVPRSHIGMARNGSGRCSQVGQRTFLWADAWRSFGSSPRQAGRRVMVFAVTAAHCVEAKRQRLPDPWRQTNLTRSVLRNSQEQVHLPFGRLRPQPPRQPQSASRPNRQRVPRQRRSFRAAIVAASRGDGSLLDAHPVLAIVAAIFAMPLVLCAFRTIWRVK